MKKKLMLATALLTLGAATNVKADTSATTLVQNKFILDGPQQKVKQVTVSDFTVGDSEIKVWLPQAWSVKVSRESNQTPDKEQKPSSNQSENKEGNFSKRLPYNTQHTIKLSSQLKKGEKVTFTFRDEDFWGAGYSFYRDSASIEEDKQYDEEIKKIEDELERQDQENDALELFKQQHQEEAQKTWHQRLSDSIQDQWWNLKGWLRG
ncbi:TPA: hypothetical protein ACF4FK_000877 [Streptococcus pyogenes]|uniref:hypothetical protein n=1 Tax=Streptococcus pyogenes TaxID=1314 RepID=UPI0010115D2D|nr:hypothetical protein [Streptococcus pyogenes]RXS22263.1 hypothetical protein ER610_06675 [Streptococcus pyogenes]VGQ96500.1 phage protein [Streptococcus pyogenes]VGT56905.1 phage protein [Streptococcus pyogenes]VGY23395.1 phage protein [Streptococcus pyogenes]VGY46798.1 phage protein [Streptococcus pyogenes]